MLSRGLDQEGAWTAAQTELLALSSKSRQLFAEKSDHSIELSQPEAAVDAIRQMIELVRKTG